MAKFGLFENWQPCFKTQNSRSQTKKGIQRGKRGGGCLREFGRGEQIKGLQCANVAHLRMSFLQVPILEFPILLRLCKLMIYK